MICPKCSFALTELKHRYKCAKCCKVFLKKEVEDFNFRNWNKKQREVDRHNLKLKRPKLSQEEKEERRALVLKQRYLNKKEEMLKKIRLYQKENKDKINLKYREKRKKNPEYISTLERIKLLKKKQEVLIEKKLKEEGFNGFV